MNSSDCINERISSRMLGIIVLAFSMLLAVVGGILLPVFGFFFAAPLLLLGGVLTSAPESQACRLLHGK